ncbi:MAG TPA: homogentisate 1,2-dioxygenase [Chitinophagaceae bacterium]|nr:MAG: homogentisate 12-dioxygenase [Bacteroidetes bacterium OLB11]HMN32896.1 homogentisate 1,2-dioxygenase [Chitinophagaceae bacterium]
MPHYYSLGKIPHKRHTQFRKPDGSLYSEELFSTEGFNYNYCLIYHVHPPTVIVKSEEPIDITPKIATDNILKHRSFQGFKIKKVADYLESRKPILVNNDCHITLAAPQQSMDKYFFRNSDADECIFIHEGTGKLHTLYGELPFKYGDYIIIPRGIAYQIKFDTEDNRLLIVESYGPIRFPKRYKTSEGQLMEHAPFCERDIRKPENLKTHDEKGEFLIYTKKQNLLYPITYGYHPFDAIGWDGYEYPYIFSIHDFEPITGRVHLPPPIHQTFEGKDMVICSFVPRLYDYHPNSIPAPYNHSNIDSDEVLYYVDGEFMSRKHVTRGMLTLHPSGIPHGPHPGAVEKSIGKKETPELAVMIDTFRPLHLTNYAVDIEDENYEMSWAE